MDGEAACRQGRWMARQLAGEARGWRGSLQSGNKRLKVTGGKMGGNRVSGHTLDKHTVRLYVVLVTGT